MKETHLIAVCGLGCTECDIRRAPSDASVGSLSLPMHEVDLSDTACSAIRASFIARSFAL